MTTTTDGPITILQLAEHRGVKKDPDGVISAQAFADVGLAIMGGCARCFAALVAYNAYPSQGGYWLCEDCLGESGFPDVESADEAIFGKKLDPQTEGTWELSETGDTFPKYVIDALIQHPDDSTRVATQFVANVQTRGDALLFMAAPKLLAALKGCMAVLENVRAEHPDEYWLGSEYNAAHTAIWEAERGQ